MFYNIFAAVQYAQSHIPKLLPNFFLKIIKYRTPGRSANIELSNASLSLRPVCCMRAKHDRCPLDTPRHEHKNREMF